MHTTALVTGTRGFLGRHAARRLAEEGWRVIGIGNGDWTRRDALRWGVSEWHSAHVRLDALIEHGEEPDLIIHCAGSGSVAFSIAHPYHDFERTVCTTAAVLEFVRTRCPGARVVLPSSAAVYGVAERSPIEETDPLRPVSPYGMHKRMMEQLCCSFGRHHQVCTAIVRLFSVYGPELRKQLLWDACQRIRRNQNGFFGTGDERRDLIHVSDAVNLLLLVAQRASTACPIVNGGTGESTSVREVLIELFRTFGRTDLPQFTERMRPGDPPAYVASVGRARAWGWSPAIPLLEGLREYADWYRRNSQ